MSEDLSKGGFVDDLPVFEHEGAEVFIPEGKSLSDLTLANRSPLFALSDQVMQLDDLRKALEEKVMTPEERENYEALRKQYAREVAMVECDDYTKDGEYWDNYWQDRKRKWEARNGE